MRITDQMQPKNLVGIKPIVVLGFPGMGKSYLCKRFPHVTVDSDSSHYTGPNRFYDYVEHIATLINLSEDGYDCEAYSHYPFVIFASTHKEVRAQLQAKEIPYALWYPFISARRKNLKKFPAKDFELKKLFMKRYRERGNTPDFIQKLDDWWEEWICALSEDNYATEHIGFHSRAIETYCYDLECVMNRFLPIPEDDDFKEELDEEDREP